MTAVVPDFSRSSLTWKTRSGYCGGWRLVATAARLDADGRVHEEYGLASMVMAGNAAGYGPLAKSPAYSYQILASPRRHVIFRTYVADGRSDDSENENSALFEHLALEIPRVRADCVERRHVQPDLLRSCGALVGVIEEREDGERWRLAFPVHHLTYGPPAGGPALQLETGPLPVPARWLGANRRSQRPASFDLAFLFWRDWSRLEFQSQRRSGEDLVDATGRLMRATLSFEIWALTGEGGA